MGAVPFPAVFHQQLHPRTIATPCPPRSWYYSEKPFLAVLCASRRLLLSPSSLSDANSNHYSSGIVSRREAAAAIVLLLQSVQFSVALGGDACALDDSSISGLERGSDSEQVEPNQILEMARLDGGEPILLPKSVFYDDFKSQRVIPPSKQQFRTASIGWMKSSGSSLGLLGGIIFGFLFLRERQERTANDELLEDVHIRTKKADTELFSRTRSTLRLKSDNSQASNQACRVVLQSEASLSQVMSTKSNAIEFEEELHVQRNMFQSLKQKENGLKAGLEKLEKECRCLMEELNGKLESGQILEAQLRKINLLLQSEENEINSLKLAIEDQEKVVTDYLQEENVVEDSLDKAKSMIQDVEESISRSSKSLGDDMVRSMTEDLTVVTSRNEISDKKLNELYKDLQEARQIFLAEMAHVRNLLSLKEREAYNVSTELIAENGEVEASLETLGKFRSEKENLNRVFMNKKDILSNMKEQLETTRKQLDSYEVERATLLDALNKQLAKRPPVEGQCEINGILLQHAGSSMEVEGEIDRKMYAEAGCLGKENASTTALAQELLEAGAALRASENEVSSLQDSLKSYLTQEAQLEEDLVALGEKRQGYSMALRKEKRASAYAKKKLAVCEEVLAGETTTMQGLSKELEQTRQHLHSLKEQSSVWAHEIEIVNTRALCLEEEISLLKVHLENEGTSRKEPEKKFKKIPKTASRPARNERRSKTNSVKSRKTHLHQPLKGITGADDALGTATVS